VARWRARVKVVEGLGAAVVLYVVVAMVGVVKGVKFSSSEDRRLGSTISAVVVTFKWPFHKCGRHARLVEFKCATTRISCLYDVPPRPAVDSDSESLRCQPDI
jgi:hypothetical protein